MQKYTQILISMGENMRLRYPFFILFMFFIISKAALAYEANCSFERGLVDSGNFAISVKNGKLIQTFAPMPLQKEPTHFQYRFQYKQGDSFCYQKGSIYDENFFSYGLFCLGKFNNGSFPFSLEGNDGVAYGTCEFTKSQK